MDPENSAILFKPGLLPEETGDRNAAYRYLGKVSLSRKLGDTLR